MNLLLVLII